MSRIFRYIQVDTGPRRSPSACAEVLEKKALGPDCHEGECGGCLGLNCFSCHPEARVEASAEALAPRLLVPPTCFEEVEWGYHLMLDLFRNDWMVDVIDTFTAKTDAKLEEPQPAQTDVTATEQHATPLQEWLASQKRARVRLRDECERGGASRVTATPHSWRW